MQQASVQRGLLTGTATDGSASQSSDPIGCRRGCSRGAISNDGVQPIKWECWPSDLC